MRKKNKPIPAPLPGENVWPPVDPTTPSAVADETAGHSPDIEMPEPAAVPPVVGAVPPPGPYGAPYPPPGPPRKPRSRHQKKRIRLIIGLSITALVIAGIVYGMIQLFFLEKPIHFDTEFISRGSLSMTVQGYGQVKPVESHDIGTKVKARVTESYFTTGDMVSAGDLLFVLQSDVLDAEVADLQEKIEKANEDIEAVLGDQETLMQNLTVTAPFAGKLLEAPSFKEGDRVEIGIALGTLVDDATMKARLYFSYAFENDIRVGQSAQVSVPAAMAVLEGKVSEINKVRRPSPEGAMLFEVVITVKNPGTLTADMTCSAVLSDAQGGEITPYDAGKLEYLKTENLQIRAPGILLTYNAMSYKDYAAGALICRIEYREDDTQVAALRKTLKDLETQLAEKMLEYDALSVTSPIEGTVMYNNAVVGGTVEPGLAIVSVAQMQTMIIEAQVDERDIGGVKPNMSQEINSGRMHAEKRTNGMVKSVTTMGAGENGMASFPAVFSVDNAAGTLLPGMYINYVIPVDERFDILVAPVIAVKNTNEAGTCVFVKTDVRPDNAVDLAEGIVPPGFFAVPVVCGIGNEFGIEIISGVEEGAEVFTQISVLDDPDGMYGGYGSGAVIYG